MRFLTLVVTGWALTIANANAQQAPPPAPPPSGVPGGLPAQPPPPDAKKVAATVNGQPVLELAVYRALMREPPQVRAQARKEILNYLVDNLLIDQYLTQLKISVEAKEVEEKIGQIKAEAEKSGTKFEAMLQRLYLTEPELRKEMESALRWDKFVKQQAKENVLQDLFAKNKDLFNGSQMQARHILVTVGQGTQEQALIKLAGLKKQIQQEVQGTLAKLPPGTDATTQEKTRINALVQSFAKAAAQDSACPSKENGGDVGWFPRSGAMVEPFARAAFALQPFQMSDAVVTDFGYHLILATDRKPGRDVKYEDVRPFVVEVYSERLRDAVVAAMKPRSKISISQ